MHGCVYTMLINHLVQLCSSVLSLQRNRVCFEERSLFHQLKIAELYLHGLLYAYRITCDSCYVLPVKLFLFSGAIIFSLIVMGLYQYVKISSMMVFKNACKVSFWAPSNCHYKCISICEEFCIIGITLYFSSFLLSQSTRATQGKRLLTK